MRKFALFATMVMLLTAIAAPASATRPGTDEDLVNGHKIWICHATRSLSNPYVKILIDIAAWDIDDPDSNDHGPDHHAREKDGVEWADYALASPADECGVQPPPPPPPPPPPTGPKCLWADNAVVDYVVNFPGDKLYTNNKVLSTQVVNISKGTYEVVLVSSDTDRGSDSMGNALIQNNEQWRLRGSVPSGYAADLPDTVADIVDQATTHDPMMNKLTVTFDGDVTELVAEHWSVAQTSSSADSVVPQAACLKRVDG